MKKRITLLLSSLTLGVLTAPATLAVAAQQAPQAQEQPAVVPAPEAPIDLAPVPPDLPAPPAAPVVPAVPAPPPVPIPQAELPTEAMNGIKNPELKSYRNMLAGLDTFDAKRSLAPNAELRFLLIGNTRRGGGASNGAQLRIVGNLSSMSVPIAADGSFSLPRSQAAYDDDADLVLNRRALLTGWSKLLGFQPEVRSAGVPNGARRLGDLRLECEVLVAITREEMGFIRRTAASAMLLGKEPCKYRQYGVTAFDAPQPLQRATLTSEGRRLALPVRGRNYLAPLPDAGWPDDALIEFQFAPEGAVVADKWNNGQ